MDIKYSMEKNTDFKLNYCHVFLHKSKEKFTATGEQVIENVINEFDKKKILLELIY